MSEDGQQRSCICPRKGDTNTFEKILRTEAMEKFWGRIWKIHKGKKREEEDIRSQTVFEEILRSGIIVEILPLNIEQAEVEIVLQISSTDQEKVMVDLETSTLSIRTDDQLHEVSELESKADNRKTSQKCEVFASSREKQT